MTPKERKEVEETLPLFTGTFAYHKMYPSLLLTDGAIYLCEQTSCYWLIDIIFSYQCLPHVRGEAFQFYELSVHKEAGHLRCTDGNDKLLQQQKIPYTDFPLQHIKLYYVDGVVMLPSEY